MINYSLSDVQHSNTIHLFVPKDRLIFMTYEQEYKSDMDIIFYYNQYSLYVTDHG